LLPGLYGAPPRLLLFISSITTLVILDVAGVFEVLFGYVYLDIGVCWGLIIEIVIKVLIENGFVGAASLGMDG